MPARHGRHYTDRPGDRVVGVLGGMGPHATADFFATLVRLTPAARDWDHLHVIVDCNPRMPSRTRAFVHGEASPISYLVDGARRLAAAGAEVIAVPCNSASYFLAEVRAAVTAEVLDPVGATAAAIGCARPLVLGGMVTVKAALYRAALAGRAEPLHPDDDAQAEVAAIIERLKQLDTSDAVVERTRAVIDRGLAAGADGVILGCTELGLIAARLALPVPVHDSNELLARAVLARAWS